MRSQLVGFAAIAIGILDWTSIAAQGPPSSRRSRHRTSRPESINVATDGGQPDRSPGARQPLVPRHRLRRPLFITVVIYGMWVATGVAAEKSSRVMELMISAASPSQLLTGKVVGIGLAGLTQYAAIAIPALARARVPGPDRRGDARPGLGERRRRSSACRPRCSLAYGVFFLLGFTLFALIYASMGAFV